MEASKNIETIGNLVKKMKNVKLYQDTVKDIKMPSGNDNWYWEPCVDIESTLPKSCGENPNKSTCELRSGILPTKHLSNTSVDSKSSIVSSKHPISSNASFTSIDSKSSICKGSAAASDNDMSNSSVQSHQFKPNSADVGCKFLVAKSKILSSSNISLPSVNVKNYVDKRSTSKSDFSSSKTNVRSHPLQKNSVTTFKVRKVIHKPTRNPITGEMNFESSVDGKNNVLDISSACSTRNASEITKAEDITSRCKDKKDRTAFSPENTSANLKAAGISYHTSHVLSEGYGAKGRNPITGDGMNSDVGAMKDERFLRGATHFKQPPGGTSSIII